ncbi:hypothetical protein GL213_02405 [Halogeometricum borinquense]|uniref:Uncharacterized protein n=1 Tax=Halogeometricum borinquense TaxID=60847 RepID=A0A6C0UKG6_9EURY|nr:hypothetical protein [Halogeometricum borinquense]QIB75934.1 hypothetical protein G3I44_17605 [Halogeometricum borinquense]QIQ75484.1 hypothetical protein GL213_02405 [Halogeometricum borinquense]
MELAGRSIRERVMQALVVFVVFFAYDYLQNAVDWSYLFAATALFFVIMLVIDGLSERLKSRS